jgi:hypothetical protein
MVKEDIPNKIMVLVEKKKEIVLQEAVRILKIDERSIMDVARVLNESKILKLEYEINGYITIKQGKEFTQAFEDSRSSQLISLKLAEAQSRTGSRSDVSDFIDEVRKRISEKKRVTAEPIL